MRYIIGTIFIIMAVLSLFTDEKFLLELEKEIDGEKLRVFIYVPEYIYKEYKIGDYYGGENND